MQVQFIGCGDAFGSGGRFNTCFHVKGERANFLIDCGASSLVALKDNQIAVNEIETILVSHFHADHFGGVPFFILDAQLISKRTQPLTIVGPKGIHEWYERAMETSFPGSSKTKQRFDLSIAELRPHETATFGEMSVTPFVANHAESAGPCLAFRIETEGRTIAYTGDTEWTNELIEAGRNADLLIAEAYFYDKKVKYHLDLAALAEQLSLIKPGRLILTHMSEDMLARLPDIPYQGAEDGTILEL
jgi:ribonuclease BN (tRNA processing enzyme)